MPAWTKSLATSDRTSTMPSRPSELRPFERVWKLVARIPRGRVATYGQLSEMIGKRLTPVGIGWALRAVPEGALPWYRVVNSRGGISTGARQRTLLESEGVTFDADGRIDLSRFGWKPRVTTRTKVARKKATRRPS